jgi:hypothetical protein
MVLVLGGMALPAAALGQGQNSSGEPRRATLWGWETDLRLFMKDRANNLGGITYDRGLFRMTTVPMDMEYQLDLFTYRHSYFDDYRWHYSGNGNGFRSSVGSLNTANFAVRSQLRSDLRISDRSTLHITAHQQEDLRARRGLIHLDYTRELGRRHRLGVTHTLGQAKSDLDASFYYRYGNTDRGTVTAEITALDWANNVVSDLSEERKNDFEVRQLYSRIPVLYTLRLQSPQVGIFRGEAVAAVQPQSSAEVSRLELPDQNYLQNNWANYQAALLEATWKTLTAGIIYQRTFARMERMPAPGSGYELDFGNRQIQQRGGIYLTWRWRSVGIEQWFWTERNRDEQFDENPDATAAQDENIRFYDRLPERYPFNFHETRQFNKTRIYYAPDDRLLTFYLEHNGDWRTPHFDTASTVVRAINYRNYYPNHVIGRNERLTLGIGFRFSEQASLTLGASLDLDGDLTHGFGGERDDASRAYFDGGFGRLQILW